MIKANSLSICRSDSPMTPGMRYFQNRAPLKATPFLELPLGSIEPLGWLRNQLEIQAEGMTGHLDEVWPDISSTSGWLGGSGESWERGPYYVDGLLPLGYLLKNGLLNDKVHASSGWTLVSQNQIMQFGLMDNKEESSHMIMVIVLGH